ncbi:hypothetical protein TSAR_014348 [Trichomalopsis sarcophagae]|uniref:Reverse transcriptase domain-containing protein n=1 Tax=Trichomalopsis sarcophagae TaxID=543379 RepID=A0A232ER37_9HYME|nr:hypothetical protein TSAR_014348 [Trichomalopsis sarcophagae]
MYAHDVKLFSCIESQTDSELLQSDLDALVSWSEENGLRLNINKCNVISFHSGSQPFSFGYDIGGRALDRVDVAKGLGVFFDTTLTFGPHIDYVTSKASRQIDFIKQTTSDCKHHGTIAYLYRSLVLPILLYCSPIWSPFAKIASDRLESVQHLIIRYLAFKCNRTMSRFEHDYTDLAQFFNLPTIMSLHHYHDCLLSFKVLHDFVTCDAIKLKFRNRELVYSLRYHRPLCEESSSSNFGFFSTVNKLGRSWNVLPLSLTEVFVLSGFKSRLNNFVFSF